MSDALDATRVVLTDGGTFDGRDGAGADGGDPHARFVPMTTHPDGERMLVDAYEPRLNRVVTLVRSRAPLDDAAADQFLRDARIAGDLDHPSVPCILAMGRDGDGHAFYAMPKRRGIALARWWRGDGPPPLGRRLSALTEIARVVAHAHRRGVIHGRLRAQAIEIGEGGEVRVGDWCAARVADGSRIARALATAASLPGPAPTEADDLAALGALLDDAIGDDPVPELEGLAARTRTASSPTAAEIVRELTQFLDGARSAQLRQRSAAAHLADARGHLAAGDRGAALADARRALALAPDRADAAAIVARLVLEVPHPLPAAAAAALRTSDEQVIRAMGTAVIAAFAAFAVYVPLMFLQGVRDPTTVIAVGAMTALMLGWAIRWRTVGPHVFSWPAMLGAAMVLTLYARVMGPFVNAPAEATLAVMAVSFFPVAPRPGAVLATFAIPVVGTWALEALGVLPTSTTVVDGALVIASPIVTLAPTETIAGLVFVSLVVLGVAGAMAGYLATSHRRHTRRLVAQTWRIRQLAVPRGTDDPVRTTQEIAR